jgi:serine/threonine-protein kinase
MDSDLERARARVGLVLGDKWRLEAVLGVGGMAAVYRGVDRNGSHAAVKLLHPEMSLDTTLRERFLREGYAANQIPHGGVVKVLDNGVYAAENTAYLVMELLEGEALDERLKRNHRLPLPEALSIGYQVADALAAAHHVGIIHRDIKPENLFMTMDGRIRILDFGLARLRERSAMAPTKEGSVLGTPAFMPPEQALGRWSEIDARADVWSLAATLFTLISGRHVHEGRTMLDQLVMVASQPARSLATIAHDVPAEVVAVIDRALAFRPEDRFLHMLAFRDALAELSHRIASARPSEPAHPPGPRRTANLAATVNDPQASLPALAAAGVTSSVTRSHAPKRAPGALAAVLVLLLVGTAAAAALAWYFLLRG